MAAPVVGNQDYRGYLAYLAQQGDSRANTALAYTGNDGGIDEPLMREYHTGPADLGGEALQNALNTEWGGVRDYVGSTYANYQSLNGAGGAGGGSRSTGLAQSEIDTSRNNTVNAGQTQLSGKASEYDTNQRNFVNNITDAQNTINTNKASNALNLRRSMSSIAGGVRQGIRSGGVMLANMGASDSGAAQAMANAYGQEGNNLTGDANNEFELKDQGFEDQQRVLNRNKTDGINDFNTWKNTETNRIKGSLAADLSTLAATASANGLGGVDLSVVDQLVNNALNSMAAVDARTSQALGSATAYDRDMANSKALEMDTKGMTGSNPFSVGGVDMFQPAGAGGSLQGAPITQIPLRYTRRNY